VSERRIVFVSLERWDHIWRRNQFVCAELARRGWRILFVEPARDVSYAARSGTWSELQRVKPDASVPRGITRVRPTKLMPNSLSIGRAVNRRLWVSAVRSARWALRWTEPEVWWINDHSAANAALVQKRSRLVYDITDDWTAFEGSKALIKRTRADDAALCAGADAVIVCSQRLFELKQGIVKPGGLHLIPNGVDVDHYAPTRDPATIVPAVASAWPKPVYLYTGTVHPQRVDVELVDQVARRMTSGSLVFLGPNCLSKSDRERLTATGRVVFHDAVPYAEIPRWMSAASSLIVPHRTTAFVESLNPIKLWEYLASGKPIVSTDVAGFRVFGDLVSIAQDAEEFATELTECADESPALAMRRVDVARENSWRSRVDQVERILVGDTVLEKLMHMSEEVADV
jgi:teichuronic acid biosynthesis glycosyltransferase TuaH